MTSFFGELRRRNDCKVEVVYMSTLTLAVLCRLGIWLTKKALVASERFVRRSNLQF